MKIEMVKVRLMITLKETKRRLHKIRGRVTASQSCISVTAGSFWSMARVAVLYSLQRESVLKPSLINNILHFSFIDIRSLGISGSSFQIGINFLIFSLIIFNHSKLFLYESINLIAPNYSNLFDYFNCVSF